ncbi:MAG: (Fe-S)-binding protein [Planctomycetes bacterium]|nr:(Fe-S)-binding protein [Planctomycetota bacterium]MCB9871353.1 (Fe-S)-binding protein [Planctomycetota bacterium]MCB9888607.1 (Fe-S)-binding protein [Planctomycetota bacterium]
MFEQRVIRDYTPELLDKVTALSGGESLGWCYQCAQCVPVCPVDAVGSYGPRKIFRRTQTGADLFASPDLWQCTTCMNCLRVCPKEVDMIQIMPAVREQAVLAGNVPDELQKAFENTSSYGNPLGESPKKRAAWTTRSKAPVPLMKEKKRAELLWFVECYPSYHPRGIDASLALARVLNHLGVDFGILGNDERCSCDSQRLAGEVGLFEECAEHNIKQLQRYQTERVLVTDPHALNAFRREYPRLGGEFETIHYTTFLADRMAELGMSRPLGVKVTFHDPCYLGRHHGEYDAPRRMLRAIPGVELLEMGRCRENSYCCGGGGGGMWLDGFMSDHVNMRLSENRVVEAVETGADVLAVCCPLEVSRFEDAVKSQGCEGKLVVKDIIELVVEAMGPDNDS